MLVSVLVLVIVVETCRAVFRRGLHKPSTLKIMESDLVPSKHSMNFNSNSNSKLILRNLPPGDLA